MITRYYDITETELSSKQFTGGNLYFCSDSGNLYLDSVKSGSRTRIGNDMIVCTSLPLAPVPEKLYCNISNGRIYLYYNEAWTTLGGRPQLHIPNVVVENGTLTISNSKILAGDTAVFVPDLSVVDLATKITATCAAGSVTVKLTSSYPIPGEIIVN